MTGWEALAGIFGVLLGSGGVAGIAKLRPDQRKTNADTELVIQQAATQAVKLVQEAADDAREALKEARAEIKQLKQDLSQSREDLRQARTELSDLREQASAERRQLNDQMAKERTEHAAALRLIRLQLTAAQLQHLVDNGIGTLLGEDYQSATEARPPFTG